LEKYVDRRSLSELLQRDTEWRRRVISRTGQKKRWMLNGEMIFITILAWGRRTEPLKRYA